MSATCADAARTTREPLAGTAPKARGWLCVEQGGAWGRKADRESGLDPEVAAHLAAAVDPLPVRLQIIRRPGRADVDRQAMRPGPGGQRTVLLAHAGDEPWLERLVVDDVRDLLDLDPGVCTSPTAPGLGRRLADPVYLVCTHAKRDRCCATYGRPIADTLAALHPEQSWEVSHLGGHRFAGNLLVLPHGVVHGGLDVAGAVRVVDLAVAGRLDIGSARGRSAWPRPAQAAELFARHEFGLDRLDAVRIGAVDDLGGERTRVQLDTEGQAFEAIVVLEPTGTPRLMSCDADELDDPGAYRLVSLTRAARSS